METFKKYSKIYQIGHKENEDIFKDIDDEIIIQEKLDGANFRFMINKGNIIFGSRTQQLTSDVGEDNKLGKNFKRGAEYIREKVKDIDLSKYENLIFYGENMVKHTLNYDWDKTPPFLGFDIYDLKGNKYLDYKETKKIYDNLNLEMVPVVNICRVKEIIEINDDWVPNSKYGEIKAEGITFKNYAKQIFAKYVREKFREENRKVFGGSKKYAKTDDEYISLTYCTNARIEKNINKLLDDGNELDMKIMGELLNRVYRDIWEENWEEIAFSKKTIDLNNLKKLISKRCLEVLKQRITNNSLNMLS